MKYPFMKDAGMSGYVSIIMCILQWALFYCTFRDCGKLGSWSVSRMLRLRNDDMIKQKPLDLLLSVAAQKRTQSFTDTRGF